MLCGRDSIGTSMTWGISRTAERPRFRSHLRASEICIKLAPSPTVQPARVCGVHHRGTDAFRFRRELYACRMAATTAHPMRSARCSRPHHRAAFCLSRLTKSSSFCSCSESSAIGSPRAVAPRYVGDGDPPQITRLAVSNYRKENRRFSSCCWQPQLRSRVDRIFRASLAFNPQLRIRSARTWRSAGGRRSFGAPRDRAQCSDRQRAPRSPSVRPRAGSLKRCEISCGASGSSTQQGAQFAPATSSSYRRPRCNDGQPSPRSERSAFVTWGR